MIAAMDRFLFQHPTPGHRASEWLDCLEGRVYVRVCCRYINKKLVDTFEIANISLKPKFRSKGLFTSIIQHFDNSWRTLYIECVLLVRFRKFLLNSGFISNCQGVQDDPNYPISFYKPNLRAGSSAVERFVVGSTPTLSIIS